ncbi:uncharacterized protein LOC131666000 [Phymastichus coffea]|uniref:uncharacterized protein LOC131666000 n=1 Tax=Phymastichus coffea TaxID=108790 RepID=UPI00273CB17F|nr:uncharacterized protein LOC131666000 [Phymastichus coffea]
MAIVVFAVSLMLLASQAQAEYSWAIPCRSALQCASVLGSAQSPHLFKCAQGYCLCANMTTQTYDLCSNKDMILTAGASGLRRNCTDREDCSLVEGADCLIPEQNDSKDKSNKICLCQSDRVESEDGQSCLPVVVEVGGKCLEHLQCTKRLGDGAECSDAQCRCKPTHHSNNFKCIRNLGFGDQCKVEEDACYDKNTLMGENLLICTKNYGCRCKKHWTYNQESQHCEFSSASQAAVHFVTLLVLILIIALF